MKDLGIQLGGNQTGICFNEKETKEYISKMNENEDVTMKLNAEEEWNANEEFDRLLMMNMDFPDKRLLMTNMKPCESAGQ